MVHEAPDPSPKPTPRPRDDDNGEAGELTRETQAASETTESGGPKGLEPTRYGDWERNGRCIDF